MLWTQEQGLAAVEHAFFIDLPAPSRELAAIISASAPTLQDRLKHEWIAIKVLPLPHPFMKVSSVMLPLPHPCMKTSPAAHMVQGHWDESGIWLGHCTWEQPHPQQCPMLHAYVWGNHAGALGHCSTTRP